MFSFILHKLLHKKWMVLCLLIGNVLLISVAASYPMYRVSSFQKMLTDEFDHYRKEEGQWPATFQVSFSTLRGGSKSTFPNMENKAYQAAESLNLDLLDTVYSYTLGTQRANCDIVRDKVQGKRLTLAAVSGLEQHVELLYGTFPAGDLDKDGYIEIMVSDEAMVKQDVLLGDTYEYDLWEDAEGNPIKLKVVGIFRPSDPSELYWEGVTEELSQEVLTSTDAFRAVFLGNDVVAKYTLTGSWNFIWNYRTLDITEVGRLTKAMNELRKDSLLESWSTDSGYMQILSDYSARAKRIEATLMILQMPVLLLLCAFLYMISSQMLQMEGNEITLLRSRGASKYQVLLLYLMQSVFLSVISLGAGIPLGAVFCKLLGAATAFLEFSATRSLAIRFTGDIILYAAGAVLLSVVMTTIPVLSYSGLSIVNLKQSRSRQKKSLWKRMYLDIILLAISLYGYYSFLRSSNQMVEDVMNGNSLDPLLYISFSLFILGAGLFFARIQPLLLKGFFAVFKNHMKPSTYASLLSSIRTGAKQEFIILFLILTVAIGITDTTIARTIVRNAVNNTRHQMGAELVVKEKWESNKGSVLHDPTQKLIYREPDFDKYQAIEGVEQATPVLVCDKVAVSGKKSLNAKLMGIRAQGFYRVTVMEQNLLPYTYEEYLNALSADSQAVLVSENFMIKQGYQLGENIYYENPDGVKAIGVIYGFFTYWPGYQPQRYVLNEDGSTETTDEYLIVANLSYLRDKWGAYPYEVWMELSDDGEGFYQWLSTQEKLPLTKLTDMMQEERGIIESTMFQGTNGILSMSFIVILLLCCVGYLIYWIMSIRSRELLFGVLRAMGMKKREITWMLVIEQICCGLFAIGAGAVIGLISSKMFVPMIQQAYAASEQVLPLALITENTDLIQLFAVIGLMLLVCLIVLGRQVSRLNISSALKLGEE